MVKKVVASLVVAGSLGLGSASVAGAAPSSNCANAPARIARLQAEEAQVGSILTSLQARAAHGGREARRLQWPIAFLTRTEARIVSQVTKLQARCPSSGGSGGGSTTVE